jgi:hypothetical protein
MNSLVHSHGNVEVHGAETGVTTAPVQAASHWRVNAITRWSAIAAGLIVRLAVVRRCVGAVIQQVFVDSTPSVAPVGVGTMPLFRVSLGLIYAENDIQRRQPAVSLENVAS